MNIKLTSRDNALENFQLQVRYDVRGKDTNKRGGSEKDPEDQSENEPDNERSE